jgi:nucleoside-diphosphate-sugar epimerase
MIVCTNNLIFGSGLLAKAFTRILTNNENVCLYAAGVSNSSCKDKHEFLRERQRLSSALEQCLNTQVFVYFGTCSVYDPDAKDTAYVQHKLEMEQLVSAHPNYLILRLPQVAGKTPNPHTLLNFLYARIARSESFSLWLGARRNIIDVDDVASIAYLLIKDKSKRNVVLNIANSGSYSMMKIVSVMEKVVGKSSIYEVQERDSEYIIDIDQILPVINTLDLHFGDAYIEKVINKYYGKTN